MSAVPPALTVTVPIPVDCAPTMTSSLTFSMPWVLTFNAPIPTSPTTRPPAPAVKVESGPSIVSVPSPVELFPSVTAGVASGVALSPFQCSRSQSRYRPPGR